MKISVIGAGNIGGTIGRKWAAAGHEVVFGVRDVNSAKVDDIPAKSIPDSIEGAEVVLIAIPGSAVESMLITVDGALDGKILIDATNNVSQFVMNSLGPLRSHAPNSKLYRAFNHLGWENFADPVIGGVQADLFYCGDAGLSQTLVEGLIADVGLRPVYVGTVEHAPVVDNLTRLWFALAMGQGHGRHLAFKLLAPS